MIGSARPAGREIEMRADVRAEPVVAWPPPARGMLWPVRVFLATAIVFAAGGWWAGWVVAAVLVAVAVMLWRYRAVIGPWQAPAVAMIAIGEAVLILVVTVAR